jgi:hypothetical protein
VPAAVDARLKAQAKKKAVSLNMLLLDKLGAIPRQTSRKQEENQDLDWLIGSMSHEEADQVWAAISDARQADKQRVAAEFKSGN